MQLLTVKRGLLVRLPYSKRLGFPQLTRDAVNPALQPTHLETNATNQGPRVPENMPIPALVCSFHWGTGLGYPDSPRPSFWARMAGPQLIRTQGHVLPSTAGPWPMSTTRQFLSHVLGKKAGSAHAVWPDRPPRQKLAQPRGRAEEAKPSVSEMGSGSGQH